MGMVAILLGCVCIGYGTASPAVGIGALFCLLGLGHGIHIELKDKLRSVYKKDEE